MGKRSFWKLEPEQADELRRHLEPVVESPDRAVAAIDMACHACGAMTPAEWKRNRIAAQAHLDAVEETSRKLQGLLAQSFQLWNAGGLDWRNLDSSLETLITSARAMKSVVRKPNETRPPDDRRDDLISVILSLYPPETADKPGKKFHAHLIETVTLALSALDSYPANVHKIVKGALRRRPGPPPFIVASA